MKVLFTKDWQGSKRGQIKDVSEGYAQNFLIPKGIVQLATAEVQAKIQKEGREAEAKKQKEIERTELFKSDLEKRQFSVKVKVGEKGQIFGGVHEKDIAQAVMAKVNRPIDKSQIELEGIIRQIGEHQARIKLGNGVIANIKINIEKE